MMDPKRKLTLKGVSFVLTVDPYSLELTDLYTTDLDVWRHLIDRFGGNKMRVTLRGPHDYKRGMRMPPDTIIQKLDDWITSDGELDSIIDIVQEVLDDDKDD